MVLRQLLRQRSGATMFALSVPALVGALAFAVDGGLMRVDRARLQSAADAAALAGAQVMATPGTVTSIAQSMAAMNMPAAANGTVLASSDVRTGK